MKKKLSIVTFSIMLFVLCILINSCQEGSTVESSSNNNKISFFKITADSLQVYGTVYKPNGTTPWSGKAGDTVTVIKNNVIFGKSGITSDGSWSISGIDSVWVSGNYVASTNTLTDRFGTYQGSSSFHHGIDTVSHVNIVLVNFAN